MKRNQIWQDIELELRADKRVNPNYPDHVAAQAGKVSAETGKLMEAALSFKYYHGKKPITDYQVKKMRRAAVRSAAMSIRFLENLK